MALRAPTFKTQLAQDSLGIRELTREEAQRRAAEEKGTAKTMRAWALLVPERGVPLNLEDFPYQEDWYSDAIANAREVVWQKAAQVGMSAYAWRWAARRAEQYGDRVIYFFPTDDDVSDFGDQRIEPSIQESAYLLRRIPSNFVRQKHLKQIGAGWLALRGTQSKSAVQSVDADALVFDEYNYLHAANVAHAERRIAGSRAAGRFPRLRRFGYPTIAGAGISNYYELSDRRRWHVTCPSCGDVQPLEWGENMRWRAYEDGPVCRMGHDDYEDYREVVEAWRACRSCEASLEPPRGARLGPMHAGRWVATGKPGLIGFHASRLIVPRTDLIELVQNSRKTSPTDQEVFWNNDLGLAYSPTEAALTEADVDAACSFGLDEAPSGYRGRNAVVGGLDVASERDLSMWVDELMPDGTTRALYLGEPKDFLEAAEVMRRYRISFLVCDGMPERRQARALSMTFPGRVVIAAYDERNEADAFKFDPKKNMVTINRTEAIDALFDSVRQQRRFPLRKPPRRFKSQLLSPKRRTEISATTGKAKRVYVKTGPDGDDYAHAGVYALVAKEMWALRQHIEAQMAEAQGQIIANERMGLRTPEVDEYDPGLSGFR